MSNNRFPLRTIIKQESQAHYMYLQMDPLDNPLSNHPIQTGGEFSKEPYPNGQFGFIDHPDRQFGTGLVPIRTWTRSDGPEPLLTLPTMLNQAFQGFLPCFRHWQLGECARLLVWWLSMRHNNLLCNPCATEATVVSRFPVSEQHMSSIWAQSQGLYNFFHWHCSQVAHGGTWATQLTWMLSNCSMCIFFNSMLEVIIAVMYSNPRSVLSGCLNFCYGSCASLCIINVSRD